ncbi:hypothetical protein Peur_013640 [Populus x canadensis]
MEELSVFFLCSAGAAHGFKDGNGFVACTIKDQRKWRGGWFSRLLKMMEEEARWLVLLSTGGRDVGGDPDGQCSLLKGEEGETVGVVGAVVVAGVGKGRN